MNYRYLKKVETGEIICGIGHYLGTEEVVDITNEAISKREEYILNVKKPQL